MATSELQVILQRATKLPPTEQIEVIKHLAENLTRLNETRDESKMLEYGKYRDYPGKLTDEEDFKLAEWHPTDEEFEADMTAFADETTNYVGTHSREDIYFDRD